MPPDINKLELQVKSHEPRIAGLERSVEAVRKANATPDPGLAKRIEALEKTVLALQAGLALKKDAKTLDQQAVAEEAKFKALVKAESDAALKEANKIMKAAIAEVEKQKLDIRLKVLEGQVMGLISRH
jgi:hypothetical protein